MTVLWDKGEEEEQRRERIQKQKIKQKGEKR